MGEHLCQLHDLADCFVQFTLQAYHHLVTVFTRSLLSLRHRLVFVLHLGQLLACSLNVRDRAYDLAHLLVVQIFALYFIFKVLLKRLVLQLNAFNVTLQLGHLSLLLVELSGHLSQCTVLILFHLVHALVDRVLSQV